MTDAIGILDRTEVKALVLQLLDDESQKGPATLAFERRFGKYGESIDDDKFLDWLGVWSVAWVAAIEHYREHQAKEG